ncbi:hypothetical protein ACKWMZ_05875 [Pseudomonas protegens]|uniref:MrpH family fimbial adhesin n=1 Tax=Pseudomonas protegens TaxID=380021 RepID=UPI003967520F
MKEGLYSFGSFTGLGFNALKFYRFYRVASVFLLFLMVDTAFAISIVATKSVYEPAGTRYYFTVSDWRPDETICSTMSMTSCIVKIIGAPAPGDYYSWIDTPYRYEGIRPSWSSALVLQQLREKGFSIPFHGSFLVPRWTYVPSTFCISIAYAEISQTSGGMYGFYGPCVRVAKPALKCDVAGNKTIVHENVSERAIDGNEAVTKLQLSCTGASSVVIYASRESDSRVNLRADGSLYSKLTIEGKAAADGVSIKVQEGVAAPVSIKSTLFSRGTVEPGEFSGSIVLRISPP